MLNSARIGVAALAAIALGLVALISRDVFLQPTPRAAAVRTATVTRGTVRSAVSGTGSLVPASQQNVSFRVSGQLTEVDVRVGDRVKAGQVLARIDPRAEQVALDQAQAALATAQANLQAALTPATPDQVAQLQHSLATARQAYADTQASVGTTNQQDAAAVDSDRQQLAADQAQQSADQAALAASVQYAYDKQVLQADQAALQQAEQDYLAAGCASDPSAGSCPTYSSTIASKQAAVTTDQQRVSQDQSAVDADATRVSADQSKLATDSSKQAADQAAGQRSLDQAAAAVTSAQDALNLQTEQKPNQVAAAQASVQTAQSQVQTAQQNLDAATLSSPVDGTVTALNGTVGETVGPGSGTTSLAPGSTAPEPAASSGSSSGGAGAASSGGGAFAVISDDAGLQAVVPFAEADASRLEADQPATLTFDAVQNLSLTGHVLAVSASSTVVSNVVNYYATITLDDADARLKQGMTANASVEVSNVSYVQVEPNSAVTHVGQVAFVTLLRANGSQARTQVEVGAVGDTESQLLSGVSEGDRVVLPQLRAPTTTGTGGGRLPGAGGGGFRVGG